MTWIKVGDLGVDSGTIMVGDPCYSLDKHPENRDDFYRAVGISGNSQKFKLKQRSLEPVDDVNYSQVIKVDGEFVTVQSGFGDGLYPVFVRKDAKSGRVAELRVIFIPEI